MISGRRAQAVGSAGGEVFQHHVRLLDQLPEDPLAFQGVKVEQQRALAPVEIAADAGVGSVDLDHIGAELQQQPAAGRSGQGEAEVHDLQALQGVPQVRLCC